MIEFKCERCGKCCRGESWLANLIRPADVERWQSASREDILKYVCRSCCRLIDPEKNGAAWRRSNCPFLQTANGVTSCGIYEARPEVCREYPIRRCNNPSCAERIHFHPMFWKGDCPALRRFRRDVIRSIETQIELAD